MAKIKREDYLCISSMLHARTSKMLDGEKAMRMISAAGFEEAAKMLMDCGYEDMSQMNVSQVEEALCTHKRKIYDELLRIVPCRDLLNMFRIKYDYHNAKVIVKACAMKKNADKLLSHEGRVQADALKEAFVNNKYSWIPGVLAKAVKEASLEMAKSANPQEAEFILDRAYFDELKTYAESIDNDFIASYVKLMIDCANLKSVVRCIKMGKPAAFTENVLIKGGNLSTERLLSCTVADDLVEFIDHGVLKEAAILGAEVINGAAMTGFELALDNVGNSYIKGAKKKDYGPETVAGYLVALDNEITAVRMILCGKLNGVDQDVLKERLRDLYA